MTGNGHRVHDQAIERLLPEIEWLSDQGNATPHHCGIIDEVDPDNVVPMLDTFHANIEEASLASAIRTGGKRTVFVHSTDSNRLPPGFGSIDFKSVLSELLAVGYEGYLSIESMPIGPNADSKVNRGLNYLKAIYDIMPG